MSARSAKSLVRWRIEAGIARIRTARTVRSGRRFWLSLGGVPAMWVASPQLMTTVEQLCPLEQAVQDSLKTD